MKLAILAGGKGKRLGLTHIPKPMVPIGGKPLLQHQIELAKSYGIVDIFILSGHLSQVIYDYFKNGAAFGVNITHIIEPYPLGTAGSVKLLEHIIKDENFLLFYGDLMLNLHLSHLIYFHKKRKPIATLVVHPNDHPYDSDLVELDSDGYVKTFHSKPHQPDKYYSNLVNAAVYVLSREIFDFIPTERDSDFGKDIFPTLLQKGKKLLAYKTAEYIKDLGTKERLSEVESDFFSGKVKKCNKKEKRGAIFLDRDGVINEEVNLLHKIEDFKLLPGVAKAIKIINRSEYLAVVVTNQPVVARNLCSLKELSEIHKKMESVLGRDGAYLDGIYVCPHHPDRGYPGENQLYKIICNCRKPKTGLIKKAAKELNIDLSDSYIIGDSERDILCGKKAKLTTVGVRTGYGCRNLTTKPDFLFDTLIDAVHFIIKKPYQSILNVIKEKIDQHGKGPYVILVAGNTRSGKTIFSQYIAKELNKKGIKTAMVSLDNWLLPVEKREGWMNVLDRFQVNLIDRDCKRLFMGEKIELLEYNSETRSLGKNKLTFAILDSKVIIFEGVVAFFVDELMKKANLKIYFDINDELLNKRLKKFYTWKGLKEKDIEEIKTKRMVDEYNIIKQHKKHADIIIEAKENDNS